MTIDKTQTRVNLGLAITAAVAFAYGAIYLRDIEHAVNDANITLKEVKAQLEKMDGAATVQSQAIVRLQEQHRDILKRLSALEKAK